MEAHMCFQSILKTHCEMLSTSLGHCVWYVIVHLPQEEVMPRTARRLRRQAVIEVITLPLLVRARKEES